jgi:membrane associated rhomboid family serine protease
MWLVVLTAWAVAQALLYWMDIHELRVALMLDDLGIRHGEYWRLFTYQFVHLNALHFVATLAVFYLAGREVEPIAGRGPFLALCLVSGIVGGAVNWASNHLAGNLDVKVFGFAAAMAAVLAAYATILPELEQRVSLFFLLPVRFRAKYFAAALVFAAALCVVTDTFLAVGPAGVLAGCLTGWIWARSLGFGNQFWYQRRRLEEAERQRRQARMTKDEFVCLEIDPILEKISREGFRSLTRLERRTLEAGREKMGTPAAGE